MQAKGVINVAKTFEAAMKFVSNGDGEYESLFEFLAAVVGPGCYGDEELRERLKDNPTKTFLDIVEPAEIALCFCLIDFSRKSWAHDRDIKTLPKDVQDLYKIRNQKDMTPNTKGEYTKTRPIHIGAHRKYLESSWSEDGLEIFSRLTESIEVS